MNFKTTFKLFNRMFLLRIGYFNFNQTVTTKGLYDLCADGVYRILFLEYDMIKMSYDMLMAQLKSIQEMYQLSDFYIFESSKDSYHVICFDMLTTCEINDILKMTSCDDAFKNNWRFDYVPRVLRITKKGNKAPPKYIETMNSKNNHHKKSLGHITAYESLLNFEVTNKSNVVRTGIWGIQYTTKHNIDEGKINDK
ncbi:hypothetical protein GQ473_07385 [archaeon]|nr:hypothetical protein [archaeon]